MASVVVPFRAGGKSRLPAEIRVAVGLAMLGDVLEAALAFSDHVRLVTDDPAAVSIAAQLGVATVSDPGQGQGAAVVAGLAGLAGACVVLNADVPCVTPEAIALLAARSPASVAAADGTTNALSLPGPTFFEPLYGPGSAARFAAKGIVPTSIPELEADVDTFADLQHLTLPVGSRTRRLLSSDAHTPALSS